jgi:hypothetical protein
VVVKYLDFQIKNLTGGCYDWSVMLGGETITGALDKVKAKAMAYACQETQRRRKRKKTT